MKTYDHEGLSRLAKSTGLPLHGFDAEDLVSEPNFVLRIDDDFGVFEYDTPGVYYGHYFFTSKGKEAAENAKIMLREAFKTAEVIKGLTPLDNRPAARMSTHLGFKSYGIVETFAGDMQLFIMSKKDYK